MRKIGEQTGTVIFTIKRKLVLEPDPPVQSPAPPEIELIERPPNPLSLAGRKLVIEPVLSLFQSYLLCSANMLRFKIFPSVHVATLAPIPGRKFVYSSQM